VAAFLFPHLLLVQLAVLVVAVRIQITPLALEQQIRVEAAVTEQR
jgi:hypothetical protein